MNKTKKKSDFQYYLDIKALIDKGELDDFRKMVKNMNLNTLADCLSSANVFFQSFADDPESEHKSWRRTFEFIWSEVKALRPNIDKMLFRHNLYSLVSVDVPDYAIKDIFDFSLKVYPTIDVSSITSHLEEAHARSRLNGERVNPYIIDVFIDNLDLNEITNEALGKHLHYQLRTYKNDYYILTRILNKMTDSFMDLTVLFKLVMHNVSNSHPDKKGLLRLIDQKHKAELNSLLNNYHLSGDMLSIIEQLKFVPIDSFDKNYSSTLFEKRIHTEDYFYILEYKDCSFILSKVTYYIDCDEEHIEKVEVISQGLNLPEMTPL